MEKRPNVKRAALAIATLLALWIVATLPSIVIRCSYPHGPYALGFLSWWILTEISCFVLIPAAFLVGLLAAYVPIAAPPNFSRRTPFAILAVVLVIGLLSWLTAHPGQPNCFP